MQSMPLPRPQPNQAHHFLVLCEKDDFIKYFSRPMQHLIDALQADYELTIDWEGTLYCGLTIDWHYAEGYVDVHALIRPASPQTFSSPRHYDLTCTSGSPVYGSRVPQTATAASKAEPLDRTEPPACNKSVAPSWLLNVD
jgi:hypothetical protein